MEKEIYIQLLGEGTIVYRPVTAIEITKDIYQLKGRDIYNPEDETWEFLPDAYVKVEKRILSGELVLVAVNKEVSMNKQ